MAIHASICDECMKKPLSKNPNQYYCAHSKCFYMEVPLGMQCIYIDLPVEHAESFVNDHIAFYRREMGINTKPKLLSITTTKVTNDE